MADLPLYGIQVFNSDFIPRAYKPAKKVVEKVVEHIPLPTPRPVMEEVITGGKTIPFNLNIPFTQSEVDLSFPLVGMNWISNIFSRIGDKMEQVYINAGEKWLEVIFFLGALAFFGGIITGVILGTEWIVRKILKRPG